MTLRVIGMMSGTSADGIDVALCEINGEPPQLSVQLIAAKTMPYDALTRQKILRSCDADTARVDELANLHFELAQRHVEAIELLMAEAGASLGTVDLIGLHGQTVWHNVLDTGQVTATLQIAEADLVAELTGVTTVSNFRSRDVAVGGQGAPLTAYVDWLLLRHPEKWRAVQNIGGMGNVTLLPPLSDKTSQPVAFDTGPGNALLDGAMETITEGKLAYDDGGRFAARGRVDEIWLEELLEHPYFRRQPPKTTGREVFGKPLAESFLKQGKGRGLRDEDVAATLTILTAASIADSYTRFLPEKPAEVIIGGGGGQNETLMDALRTLIAPASLLTHEDIGFSSEFKEALVFAVLGYETWHARPGNHVQLTGASQPVVLGHITPGVNYVPLLKRTWMAV